MDETKIILTVLWIAVMLTYLLGDVIRIFSGDVTLGEIEGKPMTQGMAFMIAVMMVVPILMVVLSILTPQPFNRWANIIVAAGWFLFNLFGLPTYKGHYDKFLLIVSMVFNAITIYYAWTWA